MFSAFASVVPSNSKARHRTSRLRITGVGQGELVVDSAAIIVAVLPAIAVYSTRLIVSVGTQNKEGKENI